MAIRVPDLGTGSGAVGDGDNELKIRSDYNHNFSDQNNAASRLVGTANGEVPAMGAFGLSDTGLCGKSFKSLPTGFNLATSDIPTGTYGISANFNTEGAQLPNNKFEYSVANIFNASDDDRTIFWWSRYANSMSLAFKTVQLRTNASNGETANISEWAHIYHSQTPIIYNTTTAAGANVTVTTSGELRRSTSSERYKNIIAPLELDDEAYANAMQLAPIVYRSTANADNPDYHYYSFSAEALGAYDPAFTLWRDTEIVIDEDGNTIEQPLDERQAEGLNLNAIVAFLHATNIKQGKLIADLERKVSALEVAQGV